MTASSEAITGKAVVPEVVGLLASDAQIVMANAGLRRVQVHYVESYAADREVVEQSPEGGRLADSQDPVTLYVARQSLMAYLPQVYHALPEDNVSFLKGLLYIVQQVFDGVSDQVTDLHKLFDPRHTEPEFLPWLASWLAITLNPEWDDLHRRKMLRAATLLFPHRGTAHAIKEFVRIYTGAEVELEENAWPHAGFRIGVSCGVGQETVVMPSMNLAHCFVVRIDLPADEVDDEEVMKIHQIIQAQKPAHTTYCLVFRDEATTASRDVYFQVGQGAIGIDEPEQDAEQPESSSEATEAVEAAPARSKAGASKTKTGRARRTAAPKRETKTAGSGRRTRRKKTTKDE